MKKVASYLVAASLKKHRHYFTTL